MTLLGLDFDNTLVLYDNLFHQIALEKGLIDHSVAANKIAIRDYLRHKDLTKSLRFFKAKFMVCVLKKLLLLME